MGVHRVAGDQEAVERQRLEQRPGGEGLVLALGHRPLGDRNARAAAEGGDHVERRAARGAIEGAAQRLAVDGEHPVAGGAEIVEEDLEGASEGDRIEQAEHAGEGVVAGQAILQAEEFPEQRLAVRGELGEVDAALRAADRGHQRDRQDVEQRVPLGIAPPRVGDLSKGVDQGHASSSRDTRKNPDQPETEALFFKCDSPGPGRTGCGPCPAHAGVARSDCARTGEKIPSAAKCEACIVAEWVFWAVAAVAVTACLGVVFAPLLRGGGSAARRASYDMQVHRDQLREVEADLARGLLSAPEAAATRIEISRRLLAAADGRGRRGGGGRRARRYAARGAGDDRAALLAAAGGLYALLGAPGLPDQPLAARQAREAAARADRPGQAEAEAMAADAGRGPSPAQAAPRTWRWWTRLKHGAREPPGRPRRAPAAGADPRGLDRWAEARAAQERVVAILGDAVAARDLVDLAEARIIAAGGYVSPEAEAALSRALALDATDPAGRYYSGLALLQAGRPDLAHGIWSKLVAEGPPDAPWIAPARAGLAEAARLAGLAPPAGAAPGPTADDIASAAAMPQADRQAMIAGMVDGLAQRLATEGGPPEDWARLIRSLGVLGRKEEAQAILAEARQDARGRRRRASPPSRPPAATRGSSP